MKLSLTLLCLDCQELLEAPCHRCSSCASGPASLFPLAKFFEESKMELFLNPTSQPTKDQSK